MPNTYESVALLVTTICNRTCPDCCYRIPTHETMSAHHYAWDYFEHAAQFLSGLETLYVSGGEPTLHPEFTRIASNFRALFNPKKLVLVTNGTRLMEHGFIPLENFDAITVSNFPVITTQKAIEWMKTHLPKLLLVDGHWRVPLDRKGTGDVCGRITIPAYAEGRLFPCCIAPGIAEAKSIEPTADWQGQLAMIRSPCTECCFSGIDEERPS